MDLFEPHKDFCAGNRVPSVIDIDRIASEMETYDGFRDKYSKAGSKLDLVKRHALMRGLRRGIGLFIREVSFPAYRRAVMRLASKGELAVVISDDSLAFGVNMPFRTLMCMDLLRTLLLLLLSYSISSGALGSPDLLLSYSMTLSSHNTIILIITIPQFFFDF